MPKYTPKIKMPKIVKEFLYNLMVQNKIDTVEIHFSGGGDDGNIESPQFYPECLSNVGEDVVLIPQDVMDILSDSNIVRFASSVNSISDIFYNVSDYWIYDVPVDWVNGNGGSGCCTFSIKNNGINIRISAYEWVTEEGPEHVCEI
jgi:hypothetical protein